uniref:Uncharacterized protein n=1 Tax=Phenylobacterium glaciei TaxID=2803784 RepID=A0A974P292_9CAUL|nr:hypothetical protein JKL49_20410 [Phenylobacterium glaciei]
MAAACSIAAADGASTLRSGRRSCGSATSWTWRPTPLTWWPPEAGDEGLGVPAPDALAAPGVSGPGPGHDPGRVPRKFPTGRPVEGPAPLASNLAPRRVSGHTLDIRV